MSKGFFVPNSVSSNYVANKKTQQGAYQWDQATQEVGLGQQAAFQTINKEYANTINTAYSNYLAANRGIRGSSMGQGYKEAYTQKTQEELATNVAETNLTASNLRQQMAGQGAQAVGNIQSLYEQEVTNMDRVSRTAGDYLGYLKSLTNSKDPSKLFLDPDKANAQLDDMYDLVFSAQPQDYLDDQGNQGMSYTQWVNSQLKDVDKDTVWAQWLFGQGGLNQFQAATKKGVKK